MSHDRIREIKAATALRFSNLWLSNFNANRSFIQRSPSVQALRNKFQGKPAVLVGAGPSLDKTIHYIPWVKDKAVLIASDAALKPLRKHGVIPDFVMALDPQEDIAKFLTGVSHRGSILVAPTIVHPRILDLWEGTILFYNKFAPDIPALVQIQKESPKVGILTPGGSVLSVAYGLGFQMGASPIIFVGQDLSYDKKNIYSRSGENEDQTLGGVYAKQPENIVYERGINGEILPTLKSMSVSKQWFHWAFTTWKRDIELKIVNSSEAGILTDHCCIMPFREAIHKHCTEVFNTAWTVKKALR